MKRVLALKDKAERYFADGKYEKALAVYESIRQDGNSDPKILVRTGDIYRKMKNNFQAVEEYKSAAMAYAKLGIIIKAIAVCKMILNLDPSRSDVEETLAILYAKQNKAHEETAVVTTQDIKDRPAVSSTASPVSTAATTEAPPVPSATAAVTGPKTSTAPPSGGLALEILEEAEPTPVATEFDDSLTKTPLFSALGPEELTEVIRKVKVKKLGMGEFVFRKGDEGRSIYVITSGAAEEVGHTKYKEEVKCATLMDGGFFGENAYFTGLPRSSEVRAITDLELLEIDREDMEGLAELHPNLAKVLLNFYKERILDRLLATSKIFRHLTSDERKEVLEFVWVERFGRGADVVREGEEGKTMYLVKSGAAEVWKRDAEGKKKSLVMLSEGDYFGEVALMLDIPRTATVTAFTDLDLVVFSKQLIGLVSIKNPMVKKVIEGIALKHVKKN